MLHVTDCMECKMDIFCVVDMGKNLHFWATINR